jgi:hypothetical protein
MISYYIVASLDCRTYIKLNLEWTPLTLSSPDTGIKVKA